MSQAHTNGTALTMPQTSLTATRYRPYTALIALALLLAYPANTLQAFPEPSVVSKTWHFQATHALPDAVAVRDTNGKINWYWFMTLKVTNATQEDRLFTPEFTVYTDTGQIIEPGFDVPPTILNAIREHTDNPLLQHPAAVVDTLRQGSDHAVETFILWPAPEEDVDSVSIFISGLSGETQKTPHPLTGEPVLLRKTLMLEYQIPGTTSRVQGQPVLLKSTQWVMR